MDVTSPICLNCEAPLQGPYCAQCGQKNGQHLDLRGFAHDATHEFLHLDGKILRSVRLLLLRPGELTREFLRGRRARYISPLRLYLTFSVISFALAALFPSATEGMLKVGSTDKPAARITFESPAARREGGLEAAASVAERDADRIGNSVQENLPHAMFLLMPLFALLSWLLFRRTQRYYVAHLYYSIHFHAFLFAIFCVHILLSAMGLKMMGAVLLMTAIPYHFLALRRVFTPSRSALAFKGTLLGVLYWFIAMLAVVLIAMAPYMRQ